MNEAIKLAIEKGGYKTAHPESSYYNYDFQNEIVLDPLFWQALGKALEWKERPEYADPLWLDMAMSYYKKVLTGGDTGEFWKDIISQPITEPTIVREGQVVKFTRKEE